jgi:hypothetical protein
MDKSIQIEVKPEDIIEAVKKMKKKERDAFLEDLLAATSPEYVGSIKEARVRSRIESLRLELAA